MKYVLMTLATLCAGPLEAAPCEDPGTKRIEISNARLIIEDNAADGDIGVHGSFDDHGWSELCVYAPSGELVLHVAPQGGLKDLALAGFIFESREPEYRDWSYDTLKSTFAEGQYRVAGINHDGSFLTGSARFTTVVAQPPALLQPATSADPEEIEPPVYDSGELTIAWQGVDASLDGRPISIVGYELIVTKENHDDPDSFTRPILDVRLGSDARDFTVPDGFLEPAALYEIEIIAIEASGNQTIGAAEFFATR